MTDMDYLNYKPNFKRDKKEITGWIKRQETPYVSETNTEEVYKGKELDITISLDKYNKFKKEFNQKVKDLEENISNIEIVKSEMIEKALKETGHESTFTPKSYRDLFKKKETSAGEYLIGVLEKEIDSEDGDLNWEILIEYIEIEEELDVLDYYIKNIILPIISNKELDTSEKEKIKELEKEWVEKTIKNIRKHYIAELDYRIAMISNAKKITKARDEFYDTEKSKMLSAQEINQIEVSLFAVDQKTISLQRVISKIDKLLDKKLDKSTINELNSLVSTRKEEKENINNTLLLIKQSIDQDNNIKQDLKETRRNLYSKSKQKRIIEEYAEINKLYRENSLPFVHYMKGFQDNAKDTLNTLFNQSAKSIERNFNENKEKAYETFLIQISTSQTRLNRLRYVESKQKSRLMFQEIENKYKEMK